MFPPDGENSDFRPSAPPPATGNGERLAGIRERYRHESRRYDRRWARYLRATLGPTLDALGPLRGARLLDAGCGTGLLLDRAEARGARCPVGVDASSEMLALARRRLGRRAALCAGDVHRLPFADGAFDRVVSTSSLHHWSDPAVALAEIARVTRPGGRLVLTDWSDDHLALRLYSRALRLLDASHRRSYRTREARRLLEAAGFRVDRLRRFRAGWLWGMMTLVATRA